MRELIPSNCGFQNLTRDALSPLPLESEEIVLGNLARNRSVQTVAFRYPLRSDSPIYLAF